MNGPRPRVPRRDLLRLRRFGRALRSETAPRDPVGTLGSAGDLLRASRPGMGSYFEVRLAANTPGAVELATRALDRIDALEEQLTVYRDDSEVSRLNATAHLGPVEVEAGLFELLRQAVALGEATGGAYDVTAGALSVAWGFCRGPKRVPDAESLADARARTGQHHLTLEPGRNTVAFDRPGVMINLGSIGKGYAIDRAVDVIRDHWWPTAALVHGGRSSLYALGSPPGRFGGRWEVALRNPFDPERPLGTLFLRNRAMGTSGASFQQFEVDGRSYGHILDPRTGAPGVGPASVTVLARTAAEADALSTAFYLLGIDGARNYVAEHSEIGAVFVEEGPGGRPRIATLGLGDEDFTTVVAPLSGGTTATV
ncbi:MAG: FAD:protein FMN transferase [Isosphaeraceae bacterium]|nr:FAD:protein FMN transferase [Isosphaeraceae bacterium]